MINIYAAIKGKVLLTSMFIFIAFSLLSQTQKNDFKASNNSYGIPDKVWISYFNKTALLLEKADAQSFLNYVVMISDGNMADMRYFKQFIASYWTKDIHELAYQVSKGSITEKEVREYLASIQPRYKEYFTEFQKQRNEIVSSEQRRGAQNPNPEPLNCGAPCTNPGLESGSGFWDYWAGNPDTNTDPDDLTSGFNPPPSSFLGNANPFTITNIGGFDPNVGGTILPVVPPGGGNNALQIGDATAWGNSPWGAARASISFTVSASNSNFTYRYAVVLHDPTTGHTDAERPYFRIKVRDAGGNVVTCGDYEVLAKQGTPEFADFIETSNGSDMWYRPWTSVFIPLQAYIGQCITVEFTTSDCTQGGHLGYAYVDCSCDPLEIISSSPNVCGGNSVTLTAPAGGASYVWTDSIGGTSGIIGSTTNQTAEVNLGGTYHVLVTSVAGPTCLTNLEITIGSNPSFPVAQFTNSTVCAGAPTQFTDTSTPVGSITAWAWDFDNDAVTDTLIQNPTHIFYTPGTYPVKLIITWGGCNADSTINVTVTSPVLPIITAAGPFCANAAPVNLTADIPGGTWSGPGITNPTLGTFTPSTSIIGNDTVTYTLSGICPAASSKVIVVNPIPTADAGIDKDICSGNSTNIGTSTTTGYTYSWLPTSGLSITSVSNPSVTLTNPVPLTTIAATYTVTVVAAGCQATDVVNVTVYPVTTVNAGSSQYVCAGSSLTLSGSFGGSATGGTWSGGTGTFTPNNTTLNAVYTPSAAEFAADSIILTLTTNDPTGPCTFSSSNVKFYFLPIPLVDFSADDPSGCPIHCTNFTDLTYAGLAQTIESWNWDLGDGTNSINQNPSHCYSTSGSYDVKLTVTSNNGCEAFVTKTQFVEIYNIPDAEFEPTPASATLLDPSITFNNQSSSDVNYWFWDFGDSTTLSPNTSSPVHLYPKEDASYLVKLIVRNANGCSDSTTHPVLIGPEFTFFIPNTFTPNGDGTNDYFYGAGIGIIEYDLWIFDRWGNMVFHTVDLNQKWDGKANKGENPAQIDVYVWKVELTDVFNKKHTYLGTVTITK
ncbi:MAG: PKD domain-containing protein [Bacteroidota bacterium]